VTKRQYLGQYKCCVCSKTVRVYDWLPFSILCAKHKRDEDGTSEPRARKVAKKRRAEFKAEPIGVADPSPSPSRRFEQTDEGRRMLRAQLRTQKAMLGEIGPRASYACVFGAALMCVETAVGLSEAIEAFSEEYRRVSTEWDKWKLDAPEVGLVKGDG
jgi:hypothetical protein